MAKLADFPAVKIPKTVLKKKVEDLSLRDLKSIEVALTNAHRKGSGPPGLCTCCSSS
jgi:hypothetical protein